MTEKRDGRAELRSKFAAFGLTPLVRLGREGVADFRRWRDNRRSVHRVKVTGKWDIDVYDRDPVRTADGRPDWSGANLVERVDLGLNITTDVGLIALAHVIGVDPARASTYDLIETAIGTDATAETAADTALGTEVFRDVFDETTYPAGGAVRFEMVVETTEPGAQPVTLYEAGIFDAGNVLIARKTYGAITKSNSFAFSYRFTFSLARA
jgi:hypothetical protein